MTDPFTEYAEQAARSEVAGYFERAAGHGARTGLAVSFTRPEEVLTVDRHTSLEELADRVRRFLGGSRKRAVVGYLGFDAVGLMEPALAQFPAGSPFPLGELILSDAVVRRPTLPRARSRRSRPRYVRTSPRSDTLPRRRYGRSVSRLRAAIRDGEAFQVVLAHRREWPRPENMLARAAELRNAERWAYFYHLKIGDRELVGATPESVVEVDGSRARVNPIAGTRPTGSVPNRAPLQRDRKELCEHRMLVDLARNDLGRVARTGSVRLLFRERRERFARLEHLVSRVGATLRPRVGPWQALAATFPAGTVSGAPKIRATQLLRAEERTWRGPYAGTVGMVGRAGRADWALAIRGAFATDRRLYTAAGAGIVFRSEPDREFDETLVKLARLEEALVGEAS